jgi:glycosyl transferase family 87
MSIELVNRSKSPRSSNIRLAVGGVIRALLIVFALLGTPHARRVIVTPPSLNDLYPVWLGSRELLVHHRSPYSMEVSRDIQRAFYGANLGPGRHPDQECCFAYPVYVTFLLAPTVKSDIASLQSPALLFLTVLTAASVAYWQKVTKRDARELFVVIPLVLISPPVMQGLDLRQSALLVAALLAVAAVLADSHHFTLSGVALALATIRPQMCILAIVWLLLWAASGWGRRKNLVLGFGIAMAVLMGSSEILLPGWIPQFVAQLRYYRNFAGASMLELLYGPGIGFALTAIFGCSLLWVMWRQRNTSNFVPTLAYVLAIGVAIMPGLKSLLNLVLLIPGVFILLSQYPMQFGVDANRGT